jgi:hypothetical protein
VSIFVPLAVPNRQKANRTPKQAQHGLCLRGFLLAGPKFHENEVSGTVSASNFVDAYASYHWKCKGCDADTRFIEKALMRTKCFDALPVPFSTELLDNRLCIDLAEKLNDFENAVFGPDFACRFEQIKPWVDSGCLFYSAVSGEAVEGRQKILSAVSVFITTSRSRDLLLTGQISECELKPWTSASPEEQPTIYFSSVVSDAPHHLGAMYGSLLHDVRTFRDQHQLNLHSGFGIASGPAGCQHMLLNGFRILEGHKYRGTYDLMLIDTGTAATRFWQELLDSETVFFRWAPLQQSAAVPT